jgi:hypothetical protein
MVTAVHSLGYIALLFHRGSGNNSSMVSGGSFFLKGDFLQEAYGMNYSSTIAVDPGAATGTHSLPHYPF